MNEEVTTVNVHGLGDIKLVNVVEFNCPCGEKAWEGELIDRPGMRACFHREPRCDEFERMDPPEFMDMCVKFMGGRN